MSRAHAEAILRAAIAAAAPGPLVQRALDGAAELEDGAPIHLLAMGKAAPAMAAPVLERYGDAVVRSVVIAPASPADRPHAARGSAGLHDGSSGAGRGSRGSAGTTGGMPVIRGSHPLPDASSVAAGRAAMELVQAVAAGEHLLVLLSGGASSCAVLPLEGLAVEDYAGCVRRLMEAGADIGELNTVRKHIDGLKGGRLAIAATGARVLGLVLSDVTGDPLDVIASGPLTPDPTLAADALAVLRRRGVLDGEAAAVAALLSRAARDAAVASPAAGHPAFERVRVRIIGGNDVAISGAADAAAELGYHVHRATQPVTGPARRAGEMLAAEALRIQRDGPLPACIVAGGETTVRVRGPGRGGRNQELVLAACLALDGARDATVGSVGTDGVDGPTDAAGAIAEPDTLERARSLGLDARRALEENDSHTFFQAVAGLVVTGPTGTNVNDVHVALIAEG